MGYNVQYQVLHRFDAKLTEKTFCLDDYPIDVIFDLLVLTSCKDCNECNDCKDCEDWPFSDPVSLFLIT